MTDEDCPAATDAVAATTNLEMRRLAELRWLSSAQRNAENVRTELPATQKLLHELQVHQIELEMQNEALRESQLVLDTARALYFDLYDLAPVGYCSISEHGTIMQANLTAANLLGLSRGAVIKQRLSRFVHNDDQDSYYRHRKDLIQSGNLQSCELRLARSDGTECWVHMKASMAHGGDGSGESLVVLSDITARKGIEQERAMLHDQLLARNLELERFRLIADQANLAKSDFLSSMSHELRTPLSAILGFAQLIEASTPACSPMQMRYVGQILKAGWYLLELINEILDLAGIESGKLSLSIEPVDLDELLRQCQVMISTQAQQRGIAMSFPQRDKPCFVNADRVRLQQILVNLLSNAIKYNSPNGTVSVDRAERAPGRLRISIADSGPGLSATQLEQLFQPFNRLGKEGGSEPGTGIGLVVCKRLAGLLNGEIGVNSTVGVGSVFWIDLDLTAAPSGVIGAGAGAFALAPHRAAAQPFTLLYVEDNPANLMLVEELIARLPHIHFLSARDGISGVALALASRPDVILMDIDLPDISGIDVLKILVADPITAHIPVIALSAKAMPSDIEKGRKAGFMRYLTKPVKMQELLDTLDLALQRASA